MHDNLNTKDQEIAKLTGKLIGLAEDIEFFKFNQKKIIDEIESLSATNTTNSKEINDQIAELEIDLVYLQSHPEYISLKSQYSDTLEEFELLVYQYEEIFNASSQLNFAFLAQGEDYHRAVKKSFGLPIGQVLKFKKWSQGTNLEWLKGGIGNNARFIFLTDMEKNPERRSALEIDDPNEFLKYIAVNLKHDHVLWSSEKNQPTWTAYEIAELKKNGYTYKPGNILHDPSLWEQLKESYEDFQRMSTSPRNTSHTDVSELYDYKKTNKLLSDIKEKRSLQTKVNVELRFKSIYKNYNSLIKELYDKGIEPPGTYSNELKNNHLDFVKLYDKDLIESIRILENIISKLKEDFLKNIQKSNLTKEQKNSYKDNIEDIIDNAQKLLNYFEKRLKKTNQKRKKR